MNCSPSTVRAFVAGGVWRILLCALLVPVSGWAQSLDSPALLKRGVLALELVDVQTTENIVPIVSSDEGIVTFMIDPSIERYFTVQDVLGWFRNRQVLIQNVTLKDEDIRLSADGSISLRFEFRFLPSQDKIDRRVQILKVRDFEVYYKMHEFHRQKRVVYRLKMAQPPVFDLPKTSKVRFVANEPGYFVDMYLGGSATRRLNVLNYEEEFEVVPGAYRILFTKAGFHEFAIDRTFLADSSYAVDAVLRPVEVPSLPVQFQQGRKSRWLLWTLVGVVATSGTAYYFLRPEGRLPGPPGPPSN